MTLPELIKLTVSQGLYGEGSIADVLGIREAFIAWRQRSRMDQVLKDGSIIEIIHLPLDVACAGGLGLICR